MFVLLLLVLALDNDKLVGDLDSDLIGRELLHVKDHLELLVVNVQCGARFLFLQAVDRSLPRSQVSRTQHGGP